MGFADHLAKLGISLPTPAAPIANYVPYKLSGRMLYISGMIPVVDGQPLLQGRLGEGVTVDQGRECARQCVLNGLAWVHDALHGSLDRVFEVLQVRGFVACATDFHDQPQVMNGASDLIVDIFGERGKHSRVAVGVQSLPLGVPVEIDFVFTVE